MRFTVSAGFEQGKSTVIGLLALKEKRLLSLIMQHTDFTIDAGPAFFGTGGTVFIIAESIKGIARRAIKQHGDGCVLSKIRSGVSGGFQHRAVTGFRRIHQPVGLNVWDFAVQYGFAVPIQRNIG